MFLIKTNNGELTVVNNINDLALKIAENLTVYKLTELKINIAIEKIEEANKKDQEQEKDQSQFEIPDV